MRLPEETCELVASGLVSLAQVEASAARDLAASWVGYDNYGEEDELLSQAAETEEALALNAHVAALRLTLREDAERPVATSFLQRRRLPSGDSVPSVRW